MHKSKPSSKSLKRKKMLTLMINSEANKIKCRKAFIQILTVLAKNSIWVMKYIK